MQDKGMHPARPPAPPLPRPNLRVVVLSESTASGWPVCAYLRWTLPVALDPVLAVMDAASPAMSPGALLEAAERALCLALDSNRVQPRRPVHVVVVGIGMGGVASMKLHHHLLDHFRVFDAITLGAPLRPWPACSSFLPSGGRSAVWDGAKHAECAPREGQDHARTQEHGLEDTPHRFCNVTFGLFGSSRAPTTSLGPQEDTPPVFLEAAAAASTSSLASDANTSGETLSAALADASAGAAGATSSALASAAASVPLMSVAPACFVTGAASFVAAAARRVWRSEHCVDEAHAVHVCTLDHSSSCWNPVVLRLVRERIEDTHRQWLEETRA